MTNAFGDAEVACVEYLRTRLSGIRCGVVLPSDYVAERDGLFVRVVRIGGFGKRPIYDRPRLDIEVWGPDRGAAHDMGQEVLAALDDAHRVGGVYAGQLFYEFREEMGLAYIPDPVTDDHRWIATAALMLRPAPV